MSRLMLGFSAKGLGFRGLGFRGLGFGVYVGIQCYTLGHLKPSHPTSP